MTSMDMPAVGAQALTDQAVAALAGDRRNPDGDLAIAGQLALAQTIADGLRAEFGDGAEAAGRALVSAAYGVANAYTSRLPHGAQPCAVALALLQVAGRAGEFLIHPEGGAPC